MGTEHALLRVGGSSTACVVLMAWVCGCRPPHTTLAGANIAQLFEASDADALLRCVVSHNYAPRTRCAVVLVLPTAPSDQSATSYACRFTARYLLVLPAHSYCVTLSSRLVSLPVYTLLLSRTVPCLVRCTA